jgi:hypothetical protein
MSQQPTPLAPPDPAPEPSYVSHALGVYARAFMWLLPPIFILSIWMVVCVPKAKFISESFHGSRFPTILLIGAGMVEFGRVWAWSLLSLGLIILICFELLVRPKTKLRHRGWLVSLAPWLLNLWTLATILLTLMYCLTVYPTIARREIAYRQFLQDKHLLDEAQKALPKTARWTPSEDGEEH